MTTAPPDPLAAPELGDALLVLDRMDEGFYAIDRDWRFQFANRSAETFWGQPRSALIGRKMLAVFPHFEGSPAHHAHSDALASGAAGSVETVSTATGAPVRLRLFPSAAGLSVFFNDITERRNMEQELRTRDELLTLAELSAGIGVWVSDLRLGTMVGTPQFYRLLGIEPIEGPVPQDLPRGYRHPDDRERVSAGFRAALASGAETYDSEYRVIRPSGEVRWIFGRGRVLRDAAGTPWRYSGVDLDVTDRKRQEEHLHMVMGELLHRTNNLLAVVQGFAHQTARRSRSLKDFVPTFSARLQGLGESNALLARQEWRGATLDALVKAQAAPFAEGHRFVLAGPPVLLSPRAVQNLGLAFHELCTNALKYGALSVPAGQVRVTWTLVEAAEPVALDLVWKEEGGPAVKPPRRAGFGRVVSEKMVVSALGAEVETRFPPDGIEWRLRLSGSEFKVPE